MLPLVPIYLGYLSGSNLSGDAPSSRRQVFSHALLFVAGFPLVFVVLFGLPTTILAGALHRYSGWITRIGGAALVLFGLHVSGTFSTLNGYFIRITPEWLLQYM
jgi:cytochrome c-type biogenesis protein